MRKRLAYAFAALLFCCCSPGFQDPVVSRTVGASSKRQVMIAAQQALVDEGFSIEKLDFKAGQVISDMRNRPALREQYTVTVKRKKGPGAIVTISVSGKAMERVTGGWSEPFVVGHRSRSIADFVVESVAERAARRAPGPVRKSVEKQHRESASLLSFPGFPMRSSADDNVPPDGGPGFVSGRLAEDAGMENEQVAP